LGYNTRIFKRRMMEDILFEYNRIKSVIKSCETEDQYNNAIKWANNWCSRTCKCYPKYIKNCNTFLEEILEL